MDEVFGEDNFIALIPFAKTSGATSSQLAATCDYIVWYAKNKPASVSKYRQLRVEVDPIPNPDERYVCVETPEGEIIDLSVKQKQNPVLRPEGRILRLRPTDSQGTTDDSKKPVGLARQGLFPSERSPLERHIGGDEDCRKEWSRFWCRQHTNLEVLPRAELQSD